MFFASLIDSVGHTPLVQLGGAKRAKARLLAKLELANPFGMKDRFARNAILQAKANGVLKDADVIIESSSGNLAAGIAMVGRALGHEVHIVTDPRIDALTLTKLQALGTSVHVVERMTEHGWQGARLAKLQALLAEYPGAFWPQQYSNIHNPEAYTLLAEEIIQDAGCVDVLVGAVGSGGSLCGTARALRKTWPHICVVAVDSVGSVIFGQQDQPTRLQSGLGNSLVPANVDTGVIDQVHWLSDQEAFSATLRLALDEQIFAGNSSGSVYWVARWVSSHAKAGDTVVAIFPDRGDRYYQTVYNEQFWKKHHLRQTTMSDAPQEVAYGIPVSSWSYAFLKERHGR